MNAEAYEPVYPAELLDRLATTLAKHAMGECLPGDVLEALDEFSSEVGRENVPTDVARAIDALVSQ